MGQGGGASSPNMGFKEGDAEKIIIAAFRQFPLRRMKKQEEKSKKKTSPTTTATTTKTGEKKSQKDKIENKIKSKESASYSSSNKEKDKPASTRSKIRYTKEGKQIPIG